MNYWGTGLNTTAITWLIYAVLVVSWAASLWICTPVRSEGWLSLPKSLFGFIWLGFFLEVVLRVLILSADSVDFGQHGIRLAILPPDTHNRSMLVLLLFWWCYVLGYLAFRRLPVANLHWVPADPGSSVLGMLFPIILFVTSACVYVAARGDLPSYAITPVGLIGSLWVLAAAAIWFNLFLKWRSKRTVKWFVPLLSLFPGIVSVWMNPYREALFTVLLIPFLAAVFAGVEFKLHKVAATSLVLLVLATSVIQIRRLAVWSGEPMNLTHAEALDWTRHPDQAPWMEPLRRFHSLDSVLLTVSLIPGFRPYSHENVFVDAALRGVVPRAVYAAKAADVAGTKFGQTIWSEESWGADAQGAPIAPSMPGSLYAAGGLADVGLGAAIWGVVVAICEALKRGLSPRGQVALVGLLALSFAASIERDFVHMVSTTIQQLLVLLIATSFLGAAKSRARRPDPERTRLPGPPEAALALASPCEQMDVSNVAPPSWD